MAYLYFMPVFMLCSLEEGTLWTESCPRLRATIATALNLLRVPVLGLLAFWRFRRSSVLRLTPPRWSVHTNDTCIPTFVQLSQLRTLLIKALAQSSRAKLPEVRSLWFRWRAWHSSVCRTQLLWIQLHPHCASVRNHCPVIKVTEQLAMFSRGVGRSECIRPVIRWTQNPLHGTPDPRATLQHL